MRCRISTHPFGVMRSSNIIHSPSVLRVRTRPDIDIVFSDGRIGTRLERICVVTSHLEPTIVRKGIGPSLRVRLITLDRANIRRFAIVCR